MVSPALRQALDKAKARLGSVEELPEESWVWDDEDSYDLSRGLQPVSEQLIALGLRKATKRELVRILRSSMSSENLSE